MQNGLPWQHPMKALLSRQPGGPDSLTLEDVPDPKPGRGEVRVRVHAVGVNFPDLLIIQDLYQIKPPRPFSPGAELAGVIDALGEGVTVSRPAIGSSSARCGRNGGEGHRASRQLLEDPRRHAFRAGRGAAHDLRHLATRLAGSRSLDPGETLLVLGAGGGVGLAAVEFGKAMGARVIAAASSPEKFALAREHGADAGVQYVQGPLDKKAARALTEDSRQRAARRALMSYMTRSAAITARPHCAPSLGPAAIWWWALRQASRSCRSI